MERISVSREQHPHDWLRSASPVKCRNLEILCSMKKAWQKYKEGNGMGV